MTTLSLEEANELAWEITGGRRPPMANAVIGANGFIGSRIKWYADNFTAEECIGITRKNYDRWKGHRFKNLIWAAGSARKDLSDAELMETNALNVWKVLRDFHFEKVIYISSQAVYADPRLQHDYAEDHHVIPAFLSPYGLSKYLGEVVVKESCGSWLILRPNGFVGPGLKKNVIHSLAKDPPEAYYSLDSRFQVIHTDIFAALVFMLAGSVNREVINVASADVVTPVDVANYMGVDLKAIQQPKDRVPPRVEAVLSTAKLERFLKRARIRLPTTEEAIRKWNEPYKVRVPELRSSVGGSGS